MVEQQLKGHDVMSTQSRKRVEKRTRNVRGGQRNDGEGKWRHGMTADLFPRQQGLNFGENLVVQREGKIQLGKEGWISEEVKEHGGKNLTSHWDPTVFMIGGDWTCPYLPMVWEWWRGRGHCKKGKGGKERDLKSH